MRKGMSVHALFPHSLIRKQVSDVKEYEDSIALWDQIYKECELADLTGETLRVEPTFDACLEVFSRHCERILDFGCGTGDITFQCADFGHTKYGLGIDRSEVGIAYATKMARLNHYHMLDFVVGDSTYLSQMEEETFDGIIVSNVFDVVPEEVEATMFKELTRVLKPGGLMFVKLNPEATNEELESFGFVRMQDNMYEEDGVLRLRELSTSQWKEEFEGNYIIERYIEFPYPWQDGMNRLFLLKKKIPSQSVEETELDF